MKRISNDQCCNIIFFQNLFSLFASNHSTCIVIFYKINDNLKIGYMHDKIRLTHKRTVYSHYTIGLINDYTIGLINDRKG